VSASTRWNLAELILIWKQYNVQCKGSNDWISKSPIYPESGLVIARSRLP
jgi:hypothetical protein